MGERLIEIHPGSAEWTAWLKHHRGTKTEARMLACLGDAKTGRLVRPWLAHSKFPPNAPRVDRLTRPAPVEEVALPRRESIADGLADAVGDRLLAAEERRAKETETERRRLKSRNKSEQTLEGALAAAAQNEYPNVAETDDLGVIEVVDPNEETELERVGDGQPMKRRNKKAVARSRVVSLRDDPVGRMAKRGQLGEDVERGYRLKAARHYEALYARVEIGGARGIDPTRDIVDGGRFVMPDTDDRLAAQRRLADLDTALGVDGVEIVRSVLVDKFDIARFAAMLGMTRRWDVEYFGRRFRECLDLLVAALGLKPRPNSNRHRSDGFAELASVASNLELHRAVMLARTYNAHVSRDSDKG